MFVLGSLQGRHLLVLTNGMLGLGRKRWRGRDGVKEWQLAVGYDNGDILGWRTSWWRGVMMIGVFTFPMEEDGMVVLRSDLLMLFLLLWNVLALKVTEQAAQNN